MLIHKCVVFGWKLENMSKDGTGVNTGVLECGRWEQGEQRRAKKNNRK